MNRAKILVVDDVVDNIQLVSNILKEKDYSIVFAKSGRKALDILDKSSDIDLILLDVQMPEMSGIEVCKILKSDNKHKDIPIIFLTANSKAEDIKSGFEAGAEDYVIKPFNATELLVRVSTHLELFFSRKKLKDRLESNINLLNQYRDVIDRSSFVSKTDLNGVITYVNDAFISISGYTKDELIGKHHGILRHQDEPNEKFQELWETIKSKKIWQGEIKNLKKDGTSYIVYGTIMPILNSNGEIEEYISATHDITEIYRLQGEIEDTQKEVVFTMGSIGETRSKETGNHVKRVAEYSKVLAEHIGLDREQINLLVDASPMHDIGKVAIPDYILHKPGRLTEEEFAIMKSHSEIGHTMLNHSSRPLLKVASKIALEHHEKWNGKGYPQGLKGAEISIEGRITAVADVFDALGSDRVYKKAWNDEKIFKLFEEERGEHFDPELIDIFFKHFDEFVEIRKKFIDI